MYLRPPETTSLNEILPSEPFLMMGAGPVPISARVAAANGLVINHLGEPMSKIISQVKEMTKYVFQTESPNVFGVAGPGSAAMEMGICNVIEPGDEVLCLCNGFFSSRMAEMAKRAGANVTTLVSGAAMPVTADDVKKCLAEKSFKALTIVHGETSETVCNVEMEVICKMAKEHEVLTIVDGVCTVSTMPLPMDEWGIDVIITGGQKGLSSIPGVSLIAFSERSWQKVLARRTPPAQWCYDAALASNFWHKNGYHYTAPVSGILAVHEALKLVCEETLPLRFKRHRVCSTSLQQGIESMGISLYTAKSHRLNSVIGVVLPEKVRGLDLLKRMSQIHRVEISGTFGAPIVRIGQMGEQCRGYNLFRTMYSLGESLSSLGVNVDLPAGMAQLERSFSDLSHDGSII